jgi:hypothetical protein
VWPRIWGISPHNIHGALPIVKHEVNITTPQQILKHFLSTYEGVQGTGLVHTYFLRLRGILHIFLTRQNLFPILKGVDIRSLLFSKRNIFMDIR